MGGSGVPLELILKKREIVSIRLLSFEYIFFKVNDLNVALIIGTAGAGKTYLTGALADYIGDKGEDVLTMNLDPGVRESTLPFSFDINVREYVKTEEVTESYELGPNSSLVTSFDLVANYVQELKRKIRNLAPDYLIVDTVGQMELFAYRPTGTQIIEQLFNISGVRLSLVYLFDPYLCTSTPNSMLSAILLSLSVFWRFNKPMINILSKKDLYSEEKINKALSYMQEPSKLWNEKELFDVQSPADMLDVLNIENEIFRKDLVPVSAVEGDGLMELFALLKDVWGIV